MTKLKQGIFLWFILTTTFVIFLFICVVVNNQLSFFSSYGEVYENKSKWVSVTGLAESSEKLSSIVLDNVPENQQITFSLPIYNEKAAIKIIFPQRFLGNLETIKGTYFTKEDKSSSVVIGKDVWSTLSNKERQNNYISIYDQDFRIKGILSESPYDEAILVNGHAAMNVPRIIKNIEEVTVSSPTYEQSQQTLENFLTSLPKPPAYVGKIQEALSGMGEQTFSKIFQQYQSLFVQLFLVVLLSMGIHYYQRFDSWRLELGIRKMVGANNLQLVWDTFKKFFILTSVSFCSALGIYFSGVFLFREVFAYPLDAILLSVLQVFLIYGCLLLVLFIVSMIYAGNVNVTKILERAEA